MTRLIHITDLHAHQPWYAWAAAHAADYDAWCLSGDLLDMFLFDESGLAARSQIHWVQNWAATFPGRLFICSGNHDYFLGEEDDPMAEARWLHMMRRREVTVDGESEMFKGWRFFCKPWSGGTPPLDQRLVLLAHAPPEGLRVGDEGYGGGDFELAQILRDLVPGSLVLSGHLHRPKSWHDVTENGVHCFNPGHADPRKHRVPNHIVIDLERRRASFHGWGEHRGMVSLD